MGGKVGPLKLRGTETTLKLHVFIDKCVFDVFANDRDCWSRIIYLEIEDLGIEVFAKGGTAKLKSLNIWLLKSIW